MALPKPLKRRRDARRTPPTLERQRDDMPKTGLFAEPLRVASLTTLEPEVLDDGQRRATFLVEVRDTTDRRCPDISVEARVSGPERTRTVQGTTDLMGRLRFRMTGPAGDYAIEVTDVGANGLRWDPSLGVTAAAVALA